MSDNPAHLKHDIDSGRTGDKAGGFDPGAAPLGTDAEAGGAPPTAQEVAMSRRDEQATAGDGARRNAVEPELQPNANYSHKSMGWGVAVGAGAAVAMGALLLAVL